MSNSHSSNISIITTIFVEQPLLLFNALQHMPNHLFLNICPMHYIQKILCAPHMLHLCPMQLFHHSTTCSKSKQQCSMLPTTFPHAKIRKHLCLYAYAPLFSQYAPPFRSSPSPTKKDTILHHCLSTSSSLIFAFKTSFKKHGLDCADAILNGRVML